LLQASGRSAEGRCPGFGHDIRRLRHQPDFGRHDGRGLRLQVTATGVGTQSFNVEGNGAAFGVADDSSCAVIDLLLAVNARSHSGLLYDQDGDGQLDSLEAGLRTLANAVFSDINEAGDI
jgi:hypothetical protein